jgi:glycerate-2-kinase
VLNILGTRGIALPAHIRRAITEGSSIVSPDDPRLKDAETRIVAAPSHSIAAATKLAEVAGLDVRNLGSALEVRSPPSWRAASTIGTFTSIQIKPKRLAAHSILRNQGQS